MSLSQNHSKSRFYCTFQIAALFLCFTSFALQAKTLDKVVAIVQGKAILLSDVKSLRMQIETSDLLKNFYKLDGAISDQSVLNKLVENQMVRVKLKEIASEISNEEVNKQIDAIARDNKITVSQLKAVIQKQKASFENYFDALKATIERRTLNARELSKSGSTMTDEELKSAYKSKAPAEYKVSILVEKNEKKNKILLEEIRESFKSGKITPEKIKEYPSYIDLGWVPAEQVDEDFQKGLVGAQSGTAIGPIKKGDQLRLLLVESLRRGSDSQFEEVKERFRDSLDLEESEKKFQIWIEKQKNQMEVTINPL